MKSALNYLSNVVNKPLVALAGLKVDLSTVSSEIIPPTIPYFPATEDINKAFPEKIINNGIIDSKAICVICRKGFEGGGGGGGGRSSGSNDEYYRSLGCNCKTIYHKHCIDTWLLLKASCPTCNTVFIKPKKPILQDMVVSMRRFSGINEDVGGGYTLARSGDGSRRSRRTNTYPQLTSSSPSYVPPPPVGGSLPISQRSTSGVPLPAYNDSLVTPGGASVKTPTVKSLPPL